MKKLYILLALVTTLITNAQAPQGFNYQATVRNSSGALIVNQTVNFKFNIMLNSASSSPVFSESHNVLTDDLGQVNLVIGTGTPTIGAFSTINWSTGNYFLGIELNTGSGFLVMGTTQLLSVPYALYANSAGSVPNTSGIINPIITTSQPTNITGTGAFFNANFSNANSNQLINTGFVYSVNPNPNLGGIDILNGTIVSNTFTNTSSSDNAIFSPNTTYYVRAFVTTENNAYVYGNEVTFTTNPNYYQTGSGVTDINGNQYPSIVLNNLEWMQKNLNVSSYSDGTVIPLVTDPTAWENLTTGAWCYYDNNPANGAIYGKLYNSYAIAGIHDAASLNNPSLRKQLAPAGWHLPSHSDWWNLGNYLGGHYYAGGRMKEVGTSHWENPNEGATNLSNFTGLPGGIKSNSTIFSNIGNHGVWWTSDYTSFRILSWSQNLTSSESDPLYQSTTFVPSTFALSVRCVKNQ
jgi:uncharacterized protein (TIGR02145 family)